MGLTGDDQQILWSPEPEGIANAHLTAILEHHGVADYAALTAQLAADFSFFRLFYHDLIERLNFDWQRKPQAILQERRGLPFTEWFPQAQFNAPANCVDRWVQRGRGDHLALIWEDEAGAKCQLTYRELQTQMRRCAAALRQLGVSKGTTVALWLPMVPEAAIALLAIGYIGAIAVPAFSGYGAQALATRLNDAGAQIIIGADSVLRRGKRISNQSTLLDVIAAVPSLRAAIIWTRTADLTVAASIQQETQTLQALRGALGPSSTIRLEGWLESLNAASGSAENLQAAVLENNDPYLLLYTSGSTGKPKGVVHPHTGFPIKVALDQYLCFDVRPGDRMLWYTDMGWMMGPFLVLGTLLLGGAIVLYDGTPDFPQPDRLWQVAASNAVTHLGLAPTAVRSLAVHGAEWPARHDLSRLRILGSTGEPWNTGPYRWFLEHVGGGKAPIINYSGGTEIGGGILGCFPTMPLAANAFHGPIPGMLADVVDAAGTSTRGEVGELVLRGPWPGMTQSLWGGSAHARDDERYLATYWSRIPNVWTHGDWAVIEEVDIPVDVARGSIQTAGSQQFWYIRGRSDDTINVAGKRVGPAEFESVLCAQPGIKEAAAIAVPDPIKGDAVVCLVVPVNAADGQPTDFDGLRALLFARLDRELGHALRPKTIAFVAELPRTRNQKIMRRVARAQYLELADLGDLSGLENPSALEAIRNAQ